MNVDCFAFALHICLYPGLGFLPVVTQEGREIYRGEYQPTAIDAFNAASRAMNTFKETA